MRPASAGMFARSLAGHDKGRLFVVVRVEEPYVYLADGKNRLLEKHMVTMPAASSASLIGNEPLLPRGERSFSKNSQE